MSAKIILSSALNIGFVFFLVYCLGDFNPIPYCFITGILCYLIEFSVKKIYGSDYPVDYEMTTLYLFKSKWQFLNKLNFLIFFIFWGGVFAFLDNFYVMHPSFKIVFYFILPCYVLNELLFFLRSREE